MRTISYLLCCLLISQRLFAWASVADFEEQNQSKYKALFFLSENCPCSRSHIQHLADLKKDYPKLSFFGVATDEITADNEAKIKKHFTEKNYPFPIIKDPSQSLIEKYRALKTPHTVLLEKQASGEYQVIYTGGLTNNRHFNENSKMFLKENLQALHSGKPVIYRRGKSLGCYIRRF